MCGQALQEVWGNESSQSNSIVGLCWDCCERERWQSQWGYLFLVSWLDNADWLQRQKPPDTGERVLWWNLSGSWAKTVKVKGCCYLLVTPWGAKSCLVFGLAFNFALYRPDPFTVCGVFLWCFENLPLGVPSLMSPRWSCQGAVSQGSCPADQNSLLPGRFALFQVN